MEIVFYTLITIVTFIIMEGVAWLAHRYLMHGWLWIWHEDHHKPRHEKHGFFEKNDLFFPGICYSIRPILHHWSIYASILATVCRDRHFYLWSGLFPHS